MVIRAAEGTENQIIPRELTNNLFPNIEILYGVNSAFLEKLEKRVSQWSPSQSLGTLFLEQVSSKNVYRESVNFGVFFVNFFLGMSS